MGLRAQPRERVNDSSVNGRHERPAGPIRVSAVSLTLSGIVVVILLPLHAEHLDRPVGEVVRHTEMWEPLHVAFTLMFPLAFIGAAGLVAVHGDKLRSSAGWACALSFAGVIGGVALGAVEALAFRPAERAPDVLEFEGPLSTSCAVVSARSYCSWGGCSVQPSSAWPLRARQSFPSRRRAAGSQRPGIPGSGRPLHTVAGISVRRGVRRAQSGGAG